MCSVTKYKPIYGIFEVYICNIQGTALHNLKLFYVNRHFVSISLDEQRVVYTLHVRIVQ